VQEFWCSGDSTSNDIRNELKIIAQGGRNIKRVKSRMNQRVTIMTAVLYDQGGFEVERLL
jgi:hypothetical protein